MIFLLDSGINQNLLVQTWRLNSWENSLLKVDQPEPKVDITTVSAKEKPTASHIHAATFGEIQHGASGKAVKGWKQKIMFTSYERACEQERD